MSRKDLLSQAEENQAKAEQELELKKTADKNERREMILAIATGGVCIALSFVLSQIKLFEMPQGGAVTPASMLPLLFFCLCFGAKKGFVATFCYSLLQLIGGYFMHPVQVLLDYTIAFTVLGVAGFFAPSAEMRLKTANPLRRLKMIPFWRIGAGVFLAFILRLICHVLSGVVFYAEYAGDQNPWIYSIVYNGTFLLVEAAITALILIGISVALGLLKINISSGSAKK